VNQTVATHHYQADHVNPLRYWRGQEYLCAVCGLPQANRVHKLPARSDEERQAEARRVGERDV
jgi:hypothetical protein